MPRPLPLLIVPLLAALSALPVHGGSAVAGGGEVLRVGDRQLMSQRHWWWLMAGAAALRFDDARAGDCRPTVRIAADIDVSPHRDADSTLRPGVSAPAAAPVRNG